MENITFHAKRSLRLGCVLSTSLSGKWPKKCCLFINGPLCPQHDGIRLNSIKGRLHATVLQMCTCGHVRCMHTSFQSLGMLQAQMTSCYFAVWTLD